MYRYRRIVVSSFRLGDESFVPEIRLLGFCFRLIQIKESINMKNVILTKFQSRICFNFAFTYVDFLRDPIQVMEHSRLVNDLQSMILYVRYLIYYCPPLVHFHDIRIGIRPD